MATFNKFDDFVEQMGLETHNLNTDVIKAMLTNTLPVVTNSVYADVSGNELANGNGYLTGGKDVQAGWSETGGIATLTGVDVVWTATALMGPFQYVILYNSTPAAGNLIGWYAYTDSISLANTEKFTLDFVTTILTLQ